MLLSRFEVKRNKFDKIPRKKYRNHLRKQVDTINKANTKNPREFWNHIKNIGPNQSKGIPVQVEIDGILHGEKDTVLNEWQHGFKSLYEKPDRAKLLYDQNFYNEKMSKLRDMEQDDVNNIILDAVITRTEISSVIKNLRDNKAVGIDSLRNEIIKMPQVLDLITKLFNTYFDGGIVPTVWSQSIISPTPKGNMKNIYIPTCYRGLSLLCTLSKTFTGVLNNRLNKFLSDSNYIVEEQAGFRKGYACIDQPYILHNIIQSRLNNSESTYCAFIDLEKCFDWIDRDLLYYKLLDAGLSRKFYLATKSLYNNTKSCVKINDNMTDWFEVKTGLKQGDTYSLNLASFYLNSLATERKICTVGVKLTDTLEICILMYADDLVLVTENEDSLHLCCKSSKLGAKNGKPTAIWDKHKWYIFVNLGPA